jgi:hypothetical protein
VPKSNKHIKKIDEAKPVKILADKQLLVTIVIVLFICALIGIKTVSSYVLSSNIAPTPTIDLPIPTLTPTDTPTPSPAPIYVPHYVAPTTDPDPPVLCGISSNCGGGTTPLRQSECANSICCQIGDKWIFYKDKNQCIKDQNNLPSLNQQVNQQRELNNATAANSNACILAAKDKSDVCNNNCNRVAYTEVDGLSKCLSSCFNTLDSDLHSCTP